MSARDLLFRLGGLVLPAVLLVSATSQAAVVTKRLSTGLPAPQASDDLPQAWAAPVEQPPTVDGRLDDRTWKATRPVVLGRLERYGEASPPSAVRARQGRYGYDIKRGGNGIWYATGIFGGR